MLTIAAAIAIEGEPAPDLFASLLEMEVETDHQLASVFRIKLAMGRIADGKWAFLDDQRIAPWKKVRISVQLEEEEELLTGYVTHIRPVIDPDENRSFLLLSGMDATCLMSLEEKIKDWPNKSDSDIAREILQSYNLTPDVEDTGIVHEEAAATIIQRETDIRFLKRLARRNGFECYAQGEQGVFKKPDLTGVPLPALACHFGAESNLARFEAVVNAMRPTAVSMHQLDLIEKQTQDVDADAGDQRQLGRDAALSLAVPGGISPRIFIRQAVSTGQPEMENLCKSALNEAEWLVEATGEVETEIYGNILKPRTLVPIKGVGELFSGMYYVTGVKHMLSLDRYVQQFTARRNALAPDGSEPFTASPGGGVL